MSKLYVNLNMQGTGVNNAADAVYPGDLVTKRQLDLLPSAVSSILSSNQATSAGALVTITGHTFTLLPLQACSVSGTLICNVSSTLQGYIYGLTVSSPSGANGNVQGSVQLMVESSSNFGGGAFDVAANSAQSVTQGSTLSLSGTNIGTLYATIKNLSSTTSATVSIQMQSKGASTLTALIGTGFSSLLFPAS